jgi:hypothetical protein
LLTGPSQTPDFLFGVDLQGKLKIAPRFGSFAKGTGSASLTLTGYPVTLDLTIGAASWAEPNVYVLRGTPQSATSGETLNLLPLAGSTYHLLTGNNEVSTFGWNFDAAGNLAFSSSFDGYAYGRGSGELFLSAPEVVVDARARGTGTFQIVSLFGSTPLNRAVAQSLLLLPTVAGYQYSDAGESFTFVIKENGTVDYDPSLNDRVSGRGTSVLTVR